MAGAPGYGADDRPLSEINVTPLVDVMLVLLVIFIVTAPLLAQALRVDLPRANGVAGSETKVVTVTLLPDHTLLLDDHEVPKRALADLVRQRLTADPDLVARVAADGGIAYQEVAEVIGLLREGGVHRLAFATQQPTAEGPPMSHVGP